MSQKVKVPVPMDECKRRALKYMRDGAYKESNFMKASQAAYAIWPGAGFKAQGAGAAASRILKKLESDGLVKWSSNYDDWGWVLTPKGSNT